MATTQLDYARKGIITEKMQSAALSEGVSAEFIREGIAAGNIIICQPCFGSWRSPEKR